MGAHKVLEALGNNTRRQIIEMLGEHPRSVGEIAGVLPISRPAVSKHLKLLGEAGLVGFEAEGTRNIFHLKKSGFEEARAWIDGFWDDALTRFKMVAENLDEGGL